MFQLTIWRRTHCAELASTPRRQRRRSPNRWAVAFIRMTGTQKPWFQSARRPFPFFAMRVKNQNPLIRAHAAYALGQIGAASKPAVPALAVALQDTEEDVRTAASIALYQIGEAAKDALPAVQQALNTINSDDTEIALAAAVARIEPIQRAASFKTILSAVQKSNSGHALALEVFGDFGANAKDIVPEIKKWLEDDDQNIQLETAAALVRIDPTAAQPAVPMLIKLMNLQTSEFSARATQVLGQIKPPTPESLQALANLLARRRMVMVRTMPQPRWVTVAMPIGRCRT